MEWWSRFLVFVAVAVAGSVLFAGVRCLRERSRAFFDQLAFGVALWLLAAGPYLVLVDVIAKYAYGDTAFSGSLVSPWHYGLLGAAASVGVLLYDEYNSYRGRKPSPIKTRQTTAERSVRRPRSGSILAAARRAFVAEKIALTPTILNEVYAMLKTDPLAYVRAQKNRIIAGSIAAMIICVPVLLIARFWLLQNPDRSPVGGFMWGIVNLVTVIGVLFVVTMAVEMILGVTKDFAEEETRLAGEAEKSYAARVGLRTKTRQFAERLEDEYGWMLDMDENHQKQRALQWYEKIVAAWHLENDEWGTLRAPDERDLVIEDLDRDQKGLGARTLRIWDCRRKLYHYAVAYSTPEQRTAEQLRLKEADRQAKSRAAQREREFGKEMDGGRRPADEDWDRI